MKKVFVIICFFLCALTASAVSYASPYRGSNYGFYTSYSAYKAAEAGGFAQAPTVSMRSTSAPLACSSPSASTPTSPSVQCMYTSASRLSGGVMASATYAQMDTSRKPRKTSEGPGVPEGSCPNCHWVWVDDLYGPGLGGYVCEVCGSELNLGCDHMEEEGYCWCPIGDGWQVWLFMGALVLAYVFYKKRASVI